MLAWLTSLSNRKQDDRFNLATTLALAQHDPKKLVEIMGNPQGQNQPDYKQKWWEQD